MSQDYLTKIFSYLRVRRTPQRAKSQELDCMSIVKNYVDLLGGTIDVEQLCKAVPFTVTLNTG